MDLKYKIVFSVLLTLVILGSSFALFPISAAANNDRYESFELNISGTAYDVENDQTINIELIVEGSANGRLKSVIVMQGRGGYTAIENYDDVAVHRLFGMMIRRFDYVHLRLVMFNDYGGLFSLWNLFGDVTDVSGDVVGVHFYSSASKRADGRARWDDITLPVEGYPVLEDLDLIGTITLYK